VFVSRLFVAIVRASTRRSVVVGLGNLGNVAVDGERGWLTGGFTAAGRVSQGERGRDGDVIRLNPLRLVGFPANIVSSHRSRGWGRGRYSDVIVDRWLFVSSHRRKRRGRGGCSDFIVDRWLHVSSRGRRRRERGRYSDIIVDRWIFVSSHICRRRGRGRCSDVIVDRRPFVAFIPLNGKQATWSGVRDGTARSVFVTGH
jgi:hypothetical protein